MNKFKQMLLDLFYILKCYGFVKEDRLGELMSILTSAKREGWDGLIRMMCEKELEDVEKRWDEQADWRNRC